MNTAASVYIERGSNLNTAAVFSLNPNDAATMNEINPESVRAVISIATELGLEKIVDGIIAGEAVHLEGTCRLGHISDHAPDPMVLFAQRGYEGGT